MDKHWCMCLKLQSMFRDGDSTCSICGGKDAYGKSEDRPVAYRKKINLPHEDSHNFPKASKQGERARWLEVRSKLEVDYDIEEFAKEYTNGFNKGYAEGVEISGNITNMLFIEDSHFAWRSGYMDGWREGRKARIVNNS